MNRLLTCAVALPLACASGRPGERTAKGQAASLPGSPASPAPADDAIVLDGLGTHRRSVTHASPDAQRWFDQGLNVVFAFNHDEAIRAFTKAASIAPGCAMAFWGIAYANGPHINNPQLEPDRAQAAWSALQRAQAEASKASPV